MSGGIGVVIPVYNRRRMLPEALASLVAQSRPPACVLIVDDGSTDGSAGAAREWIGRQGLAWTVIEQANRGAAAARNRGLQALTGCDRVAFLDSDDLLPPDFFSRAHDAWASTPGLVGVIADRLRLDVSDGSVLIDDLRVLVNDPLLWMVRGGAGFTSCVVVDFEAVRAVGGFPDDVPTGHDIVYFRRLFARGPWRHLPGNPVTVRINHDGSGDAGALHRSLPDAPVRWANLLEPMVLAESGPHAPLLRRAMARRWCDAARNASRLGRGEEAWHCVRRAWSIGGPSVRCVKLSMSTGASRLRRLRHGPAS